MELKSSQIEDIINRITREVIKKLEAVNLAECCKNRNTAGNGNSILVLIPQTATNVHEIVNYISNRNPDNWLTIAACDACEESKGNIGKDINVVNIQCDSERQKILQNLNKYERIYCASPGIRLLGDINRGEDNGVVEGVIIKSILLKKAISFVLDYDIQGFSTNSILRKAGRLIEEIKAQGIEVETVFDRKEDKKPQLSKGKDLITENDVQTLWNNGIKQLNCSKGCIITPLARDKANELGLKFL